MTPLEAVLAFALLVSAVAHVMQARTLDSVIAQLAYVSKLYADAVAQLEAATLSRDGWRRDAAIIRDQRRP